MDRVMFCIPLTTTEIVKCCAISSLLGRDLLWSGRGTQKVLQIQQLCVRLLTYCLQLKPNVRIYRSLYEAISPLYTRCTISGHLQQYDAMLGLPVNQTDGFRILRLQKLRKGRMASLFEDLTQTHKWLKCSKNCGKTFSCRPSDQMLDILDEFVTSHVDCSFSYFPILSLIDKLQPLCRRQIVGQIEFKRNVQ
ncbi:hypothetical protein Ciccas_009708, partial [Cichlidogyrus casuarinus]